MCELSDIEINALKESIPISVGERIKYFRLQKSLTQVELANALKKIDNISTK